MHATRQRGSQAVYVAGSARDFPEDVQAWLAGPTVQAAFSPDVYDCMARIAQGYRPRVIILHVGALDWNEFEFFELVARVSPESRVYVVGDDHHDDKLDEAIARGASHFDAEHVEEDLTTAMPIRPFTGPGDLVAGTLAQPQRSEADRESTTRKPAPTTAVRLVPAEEDVVDEEEPEQPSEVEEQVEAAEEEPAAPKMSYPWAPSPQRPKRIPPGGRREPPAEPTTEHAVSPPKTKSDPVGQSSSDKGGAHPELTPEELAALLGKSAELNNDKAKERRG